MRILWLSHFDVKGSGYLNISVPICSRLHARGHEIKVLGFEYHGEPHELPFSVIPMVGFQDITVAVGNLRNLWKPDVVVAAFDIPIQRVLLSQPAFQGLKYVGIFPIESDPLCLPYAMLLSQMTLPCVISKFGLEEMKKMGLEGMYLDVGVDTDLWRVPSPEERSKVRQLFNITPEDFVVLTVADNQERKNLSRTMEIFADFHKLHPKSKYVLVTREQLSVGWELRDYARVLGINSDFMLLERGMPLEDLWNVYAMADTFLLTSKAEGAGLPLLEAMACGLPCIGTNCCAIKEHLGEGRGMLIPHEAEVAGNTPLVDPFMNGNRYFADRKLGMGALELMYEAVVSNSPDLIGMKQKALGYVQARRWEDTVSKVEECLLKITKKEEENGEAPKP